MKCNEVEPYLQSVVDEETDEPIFSKVLAHLTHCSDCARHLERLRSLKRLVQTRLQRRQAPEGLGVRILESIQTLAVEPAVDSGAVPKRPEPVVREESPSTMRRDTTPVRETSARRAGVLSRWFARPAFRYASALACLVIIAAVGAQVFGPAAASGSSFLEEHARRVVRCHVGNVTGNVNPGSPYILTTNAGEVQAFLATHNVDFASEIPSLPGCELMGCSQPTYENRDVSCIMYGGARQICFFTMKARPTKIPENQSIALEDGSRVFYKRIQEGSANPGGSYGVVIWIDGDLYHSLVSDCDQKELKAYAQIIRNQMT